MSAAVPARLAPSPAWEGLSLCTWSSSQERECEIQTAVTELKRFLTTVKGFTTVKGLRDSTILGDSSAVGGESGLAGTKPILNFFFSPLLSPPIILQILCQCFI